MCASNLLLRNIFVVKIKYQLVPFMVYLDVWNVQTDSAIFTYLNFTVRKDSVEEESSCNATIVGAPQMPSVLPLKWKVSLQEIYLPLVL